MAKPTPWFPPVRVKIAVLIPTSRPSVSTSAPAEFRAKAHHDFLRARHDVISGENVAIRADNDARAKALYCLFTLCSRKLSAEKFAQGFIRKRKPQTWAGDSLSGKDGHHSRRDLFYDRR